VRDRIPPFYPQMNLKFLHSFNIVSHNIRMCVFNFLQEASSPLKSGIKASTIILSQGFLSLLCNWQMPCTTSSRSSLSTECKNGVFQAHIFHRCAILAGSESQEVRFFSFLTAQNLQFLVQTEPSIIKVQYPAPHSPMLGILPQYIQC